jgi:hypothetical protein
MVVLYQRFRTTYRSLVQGSRSLGLLDHTTLRNIPEERRSHLLVCSKHLASTAHSCDFMRSCDSGRAQAPVPISHYLHFAVLQVVLSIVTVRVIHSPPCAHNVTLLNILDWD